MLLDVIATNNHVLTHLMQPRLLIHFWLHKEAFSINCSQFWVHSSRSLILVQPHSFTFWLSRTPSSTRWSARVRSRGRVQNLTGSKVYKKLRN